MKSGITAVATIFGWCTPGALAQTATIPANAQSIKVVWKYEDASGAYEQSCATDRSGRVSTEMTITQDGRRTLGQLLTIDADRTIESSSGSQTYFERVHKEAEVISPVQWLFAPWLVLEPMAKVNQATSVDVRRWTIEAVGTSVSTIRHGDSVGVEFRGSRTFDTSLGKLTLPDSMQFTVNSQPPTARKWSLVSAEINDTPDLVVRDFGTERWSLDIFNRETGDVHSSTTGAFMYNVKKIEAAYTTSKTNWWNSVSVRWAVASLLAAVIAVVAWKRSK